MVTLDNHLHWHSPFSGNLQSFSPNFSLVVYHPSLKKQAYAENSGDFARNFLQSHHFTDYPVRHSHRANQNEHIKEQLADIGPNLRQS